MSTSDSTPNPYASPSAELPEAVRAALATDAARGAQYLSAQRKARTAVFFFYAVMCLLLVELAYHGGLIFLVLRTEAGVPPTNTELHLVVVAEVALRGLHLLVRVSLLMAFLGWFRQAYRNLPALGYGDLKYTSGEAMLSFLIPFVNLFRPYQHLKLIWRASDLSSVDPDQRIVFSSALVGYWWAFLWISALLRVAVWYTNRQAGFGAASFIPDEVIVAVWFSIGAVLMQMIAALLGLHVVKTITTNQDEKHRRLELERQAMAG